MTYDLATGTLAQQIHKLSKEVSIISVKHLFSVQNSIQSAIIESGKNESNSSLSLISSIQTGIGSQTNLLQNLNTLTIVEFRLWSALERH